MTIKELREKYNLTQTALAKALSVSSNAISGIEAGRIKLSPKMTAKIKEVYGEEVAAAAPIGARVEKKAAKKTPAKKPAADKPAETVTTEAAAPVETPAAEIPAAPVKAKKSRKKTAEKPIAVEAAAAAPIEAPVEKKAPAKKVSQKKAPEKKPAPKKAPAKKSAPKKAAAATPTIILQSEFGGEVTAEQILSKVGEVDKVYVRIDQNKLYWVKGKETGDKDIW